MDSHYIILSALVLLHVVLQSTASPSRVDRHVMRSELREVRSVAGKKTPTKPKVSKSVYTNTTGTSKSVRRQRGIEKYDDHDAYDTAQERALLRRKSAKIGSLLADSEQRSSRSCTDVSEEIDCVSGVFTFDGGSECHTTNDDLRSGNQNVESTATNTINIPAGTKCLEFTWKWISGYCRTDIGGTGSGDDPVVKLEVGGTEKWTSSIDLSTEDYPWDTQCNNEAASGATYSPPLTETDINIDGTSGDTALVWRFVTGNRNIHVAFDSIKTCTSCPSDPAAAADPTDPTDPTTNAQSAEGCSVGKQYSLVVPVLSAVLLFSLMS